MTYGRHLVGQLVSTNKTVDTDNLIEELEAVAIAHGTTVDNVGELTVGVVSDGSKQYWRDRTNGRTFYIENPPTGTWTLGTYADNYQPITNSTDSLVYNLVNTDTLTVLREASRRAKSSQISRMSLPRLTEKLNRYNHGYSGQTDFLIAGFGSSVSVGATLENPETDAPVAKFFEYFQKYFNKGEIWPFSFVNDGVNGSIVNQFGTSWDTQIATQTPDLAVLFYGMNDFFTSNYNAGQTFGSNGFEQRLRNAIKTCHDAGCDVIVFTSPHPHATNSDWSLASGVPMTWPTSVVSPVDDEDLYPPVSESQVDIDFNGQTISAAHRFLRGNEVMRRVATEMGCAVVDVEPFWFEAVSIYGDDFLFNSGQTVHPNLNGHKASYWLASEMACKGLGDSVSNDSRSSYRFDEINIGGKATAPNPRDASLSVVHDGVKDYVEHVQDNANADLRTLDTDGNQVLAGGQTSVGTNVLISEDQSTIQNKQYLRSFIGASASDTLTITLPQRKSVEMTIDGWSAVTYTWAQVMKIIAYNVEGTITYNIISEIDAVPTRRIFDVSTSGDDFIITVNANLTTIRALVNEMV